MTDSGVSWRGEARARLADRDKPLAPDEGIATAQAEWEGDLYDIAVRALDALDAVLALHAPDEDAYGDVLCAECSDAEVWQKVPWPCPTVRAIEGEPHA